MTGSSNCPPRRSRFASAERERLERCQTNRDPIATPAHDRCSARRREGGIDLLFLLPTLAILAVFLLYPLVYGIVLSVHDTKGFDLTAFVGLEHYARAILGDAVFHRSLVNTMLFTGAAVVLQTGLGLFLALLLADVKRGRTFFVVVFFAPFVLAPVAVGSGLEVPVRAVSSGSCRRWARPSGSIPRRSRRSRMPT